MAQQFCLKIGDVTLRREATGRLLKQITERSIYETVLETV